MKKTIFCMALGLIFTLFTHISHAQGNLNHQLRTLLSGLNRPAGSNEAKFLWNMSVHMTDTNFYVPICHDTSNYINWFTMYSEMYNSAYDTLTYTPLRDSTVIDTANYFGRQDTVPIGILDYQYNKINPTALDSNNGNGKWYTWTNTTITDNASYEAIHGLPYEVNMAHTPPDNLFNIFAASPLTNSLRTRNTVFTIKPSLFVYYNSATDGTIGAGQQMKIDFGDGGGWHNIDPATGANFSVTYPNHLGFAFIQVEVVDDGGALLKYSVSRLRVGSRAIGTPPNYWITSTGLKVGVYLGCGHDSIVKPVVYLKGIDPTEERHVPEIYGEMIVGEDMVMLKNDNYDFVVVEWDNSTIDMRTNAAYVVTLLQTLQTKLSNGEQIVLVGESMGGVIGEYALSYMETSLYVNGDGGTHPAHPLSHDTRLFISLDAPFQGANIPLSIQHIYYDLATALHPLAALSASFYSGWKNAEYLTSLLYRPAVRQLLIYNAIDRGGFLLTEYPQDVERTAFLYSLDSLGGRPKHCKWVAMSNGLIDSGNQVAYANRSMLPLDTLLGLNMTLGVNIMGLFNLSVISISIDCLTNPAGSGSVISGTIDLTYFDPIGCLLGALKIRVGTYRPSCSITIPVPIPITYVSNVNAYDMMPGGYYEAITNIGDENTNWDLDQNFLNLLAFPLDFALHDSAGGPLGDGYAGFEISVNGIFASVNLSLSVTTSAPKFCFIPQFSALDYTPPGGTFPLNHDIMDDNIDTTFHRSPADVIVGYWKAPYYYSYPYPYIEILDADDAQHLNYRNDSIGTNHETWLNREIGDQDMALDNYDINRTALFEAHDTLAAGYMESIYYKYPARAELHQLGLGGLLSRDSGFTVDTGGGNVTFKSEHNIKLQNGFKALYGCHFIAEIDSVNECDYHIGSITSPLVRSNYDFQRIENQLNDEFSVYPNPVSTSFTFRSNLLGQPNATLSVFNAIGEKICIFELRNQKDIQIDVTTFTPGIYFLMLNVGGKIYSQKIIKN